MDTLNPDIFNIITNFLSDKDSTSLCSVNNSIRLLGEKSGYLKKFIFTPKTDIFFFIKMYKIHKHSLEHLQIINITNPHVFIYEPWCKYMIFDRCWFSNSCVLNPVLSKKTELLSIIDNNKTHSLFINWKNLPNLKELYIDCYDIKNIEQIANECPNLTTIVIKLDIDREMPENFFKLCKLKKIITTLISSKAGHFSSKFLEICLVNKTNNFTSESCLVPTEHLSNRNYYINVSSYIISDIQ